MVGFLWIYILPRICGKCLNVSAYIVFVILMVSFKIEGCNGLDICEQYGQLKNYIKQILLKYAHTKTQGDNTSVVLSFIDGCITYMHDVTGLTKPSKSYIFFL